MQARITLRVTVSLLLGAAAAAFALDVPLTYVKHTDENRPSQGGGFQQLKISTTPPGSDYKLPAGAGPYYYALATLGGTTRCLVFTRKSAKAPPHTRLYFDANGNRDLTDDQPIDAIPPGEAESFMTDDSQSNFPPIDVQLPAGAAAMPYSFVVGAYAGEVDPDAKDAPPFEAFLVANCSYTGTVTLDGTRYTITLADGNANGSFGDKIAPAPAGGEQQAASADFLWLSDGGEGQLLEAPPLCDLVLVGDKVFRVTPAVAEMKLVLAPVSAGLASVKLPSGLGDLTLYPDKKGESVLLTKPASTVKLPPGTYRFSEYNLVRKDAEGDTWVLQAQATRNSPPITIPAEGTSASLLGEPFVSNVDVRATQEKSSSFFGLLDGPVENSMRMSLRLEGSAKERVTAIWHAEGKKTKFALDRTGRRPKEPQYKITTPSGEMLQEGVFTYG